MTSFAQRTTAGPGETERERRRPFGLEAQIDLFGCDPAAVREASTYGLCLAEITAEIGMVPYGKPFLQRFGQGELEGWTGITVAVQPIETSNIAVVSTHGTEEPDRVCLTVFSCRSFEPVDAAEVARRHFGGTYTIRVGYRG
jgi:hypothetical protein